MGQKGQSLVELAITFTILMLLLAGAFEFATSFFQMVQLQDSAQEGALYGSYCQDETEILRRVIGSSDLPLDLTDPNVTISVTYTDMNTQAAKNLNAIREGDGIQVRVSYHHKIMMPFLPSVLGRDYLDLNGSVTDTIIKVSCG